MALTPPNGWQCRCRVRALTEAQVNAKDLSISKTRDNQLIQVDQPAGVDKRTGEIITRPGTRYIGDGVDLLPDAGWSYNPGKDFSLFDPRGGAPDAALGLLKKQTTFRDFGLPNLGQTANTLRSPPPDRLAKSATVEAAEDQLARTLRLDDQGWREVQTPDGLDNVVIAHSYLRHVAQDRRAGRERYASFIEPTLTDPLEVWLSEYEDGSYRRRFIKLFSGDGKPVLAVARENRDGSIFWDFTQSQSLTSLDKLRRGLLLYRKAEVK